MIVKERFELIYTTSGQVYNVPPLSKNTLAAFEVDKLDYSHLLNLVKTFSRVKPNPASKIVEAYADKCMVVRLPDYPLPGFVTNKNIGVINLEVLPEKLLSDYTSQDIFSLYLYVLSLQSFISNKPFKMGSEVNVANMIFSIFMKMFGKKSGLIGAFKNLIPKLQFLITLYVNVSLMGIKDTLSLRQKVASNLYVNLDELNLNFDFTSAEDFIKSIAVNNIISISEHKFSNTIVSYAGMASIPMFEDISRFFATILASSIPGNSQFSYYWSKVNTQLYQKLYFIGLTNLKRSL